MNPINPERPKPRSMLGVHQAIVSLLSSGGEKHILDVGAGEGALSEKLIALGHCVTACDGDPGQFKFSQIQCQKVDLNKDFPFSSSGFDAVILADVIEHLENPWHAIREAHRLLKSNGILIISIPNILSLKARIHFLLHGEFLLFYLPKEQQLYPHITPLTYLFLERILASSGFRINHVLSNVPFIEEADKWERENTKWYRYRKPGILSLTNVIGMLIKFKVRLSKYICKNEALLNDVFFNGDALIIEALKE
ncbi:MAG: methyltransferase domain-containing protein [Candidatus Omnitrophota bacterium]